MKINMTKAAIIGLFLVFGATQVQAGECVMTVTRTPCSKETEEKSFAKCKGKATCDEIKKTGSDIACEKEAAKACENNGDRQQITKSKVVKAKYDGKDVAGGKNFCDEKRPDFNKCK